MKKLMLSVLLGLLISMSSVMAQTNPSEPDVIALKFHADWCGSCKAMGTVFTDLQNHFDGSAVLFVVLDFTNKTTKHHAKMMVGGLGISEIMKENKGTGYILLLDAKTKKIIGKLTRDMSMQDMAMAIKSKL